MTDIRSIVSRVSKIAAFGNACIAATASYIVVNPYPNP